MKDVGKDKRILGMEIIRDRSKRELFLNQSRHIKKVLKKFNIF